MTTRRERNQIRRRIGHLFDIHTQLGQFNVRSVFGLKNVYDVLDHARYAQLNWAKSLLVGGDRIYTSVIGATNTHLRELHVTLIGGGEESGRIEFQVERDSSFVKQELKVKVRDADPNSSHAFLVNGIELGTILVNSNGYGRLELSTDPSQGEQPFLNGVPDIRVGSIIQVGAILSATVGQKADSTDDSIRGNEVEFDLFGSGGIRGSVNYEIEPEDFGLKRELRFRIREVQPGSSFSIVVGGVNVGLLIADDDGRGELIFSNDPDGDDEIPFPPNFPEIVKGTTVAMGNVLSGAFSTIPNPGPASSGTPGDEVYYQGGLFDGSDFIGGAKYEIELEDNGFLEHEFLVHVRNVEANTSHQIRVDGVSVGMIHIGDNGRGQVDFSNLLDDSREIALPDFFPNIMDGATVEIGNLASGILRGPFTDDGNHFSLQLPPQSNAWTAAPLQYPLGQSPTPELGLTGS